VCVVPSLYEPFGITALEAMAAQTPVVASDTGGLAEIIEHDKTGVKVYADNSDSVAWGVLKVLTDEAYADKLRKNAYRKIIEEYNWEKISDETLNVYYHVITSVPPKLTKPPEINFSLKFERYPQDFRILVCLYSLGAVNEGKAVLPEEIHKLLKMSLSVIRRMLQKLAQLGYVSAFKDRHGKLRYYLTKLGIIKVCALFS
ncbi:MAG: glycosyltransferase, partial [Candidatus Bathyarchaeia archaeon]